MDEGQVVTMEEAAASVATQGEVATGRVALSLRGLALLILGALVVGMLGFFAGRSLLASPAPEAPLAPEISLPSIQGTQVSLGDYRGRKNVVLVFYRGAF